MPRVFSPGHRPDQPLYPDELVYTTVAKLESYLQLPEAKPTALVDATSVNSGSIRIPISGKDYRRWGFATGDKITLYDDITPLGSVLTLTGVANAGSGGVIWLLAANPSVTYSKANNGYVQPSSILSNSSQRGISKSQVEELIKRRQDYIDRICRIAWRPRLIVDEYQNFTTFKPYRRRYYTDYVGAIYLSHRPIQRVLRMGVWQGDTYKELASSKIILKLSNPHLINATDKIFFCPNIPHTAILANGTTGTTWAKDFGVKTIASEIGNLINEDVHSSKTAIQIGTMTEKGSALNLSHEFLATANSDEGDGQVFISSMRSTDEGQDTTVAVTNESCFSFAQHTTNTSTVSSTGSTFALVDASGFAEGNGLYYYGSGTAIKVARCTRNGNNITVEDDLTASGSSTFVNGLSVDLVISQSRFKSDATDEQRQKDWWSMEDNGAIMFNNQYPFFENHSIKLSYVYGQRYLDKVIEDACTKLVAMDIMMTDDYTAMFPEGTQNIDLASKAQKLDEEVKRMLIPFQESIIVAGPGG